MVYLIRSLDGVQPSAAQLSAAQPSAAQQCCTQRNPGYFPGAFKLDFLFSVLIFLFVRLPGSELFLPPYNPDFASLHPGYGSTLRHTSAQAKIQASSKPRPLTTDRTKTGAKV
jgi:hypothetical protein